MFLLRRRYRVIPVPDSETYHLMLPHYHLLVRLKQTSQALEASEVYGMTIDIASGSPVLRPCRSRDRQSPSPPGP